MDPKTARCRQRHPVERANFFVRQLVLWLWPLLQDGRRSAVQEEDVWPLPEHMGAAWLYPKFEAAWKASGGSLAWALLRVSRGPLATIWAGQLCLIAVQLAFPTLVVAMVDFLGDPDMHPLQGLLIAAGIFILVNMQAAAAAYVARNAIENGCKMRLQGALATISKVFRLRTWGCDEGLVSGCVTSMSVDCERVHFCGHMGQWIIFHPLLFTSCVIYMGVVAEPVAGIAGGLTLVVLLLVTYRIADRLMAYRRSMQEHGRRRLLLSRQALDGIRTVKMYGWVEPIERRIRACRSVEEADLTKYLLLRALSTSVAFIVPTAATFAVLAVAAVLGQELSVSDIFVVMTLVNNMRGPMSGFPVVVAYLTDGIVSMRRIEDFLNKPEATAAEETRKTLDAAPGATPTSAAKLPAIVTVVELHQASFSWDGGHDSATLHDITFRLRAGQLCCVVGPVGGGKTSFLSAVLGHMAQTSGQRALNVPNGVGYCPQEPWILSTELWQNVALGCDEIAELDTKAYERAVEGAELGTDLKQLTAGDRTEIGAHGINISGGQRARVSLARILYQSQTAGCNLVVLDDVLSPVDCAVAQKLIEKCILGHILRACAKLVVLNSHYELLDSANCIVVVAEGRAVVYESPEAYLTSPWAETLASARAEKAEATPEAAPTSSQLEVPAWIAAGLPQELTARANEGRGGEANATGTRGGGGDNSDGWPDVRRVSNSTAAMQGSVGPDGTLDASGRLLVPEDRKVGILSFSTYALYFGRGIWGFAAFAFVLVLIVATEVMRIISDLWVAEWARSTGDDAEDLSYWFGTYAALSVATFIMCLARSSVFMAFARQSSRSIHERMLARALRAPVNIYFDTVPTAQILNRLSKDLDVVDTLLPHYLLEFFQDMSFLMCTLVVVAWKAPLVVIPLPVCFYLFNRIRSCYMASGRELKRLEAAGRTPLLALLSEAMEGMTTVRAQRVEPIFERRLAKLAEKHGALFWHSFVLVPWFITRTDGVGSIFVLATAVSLVLLRGTGSGSAVDGAVAFTFIINWMGKLQWAMRQSIEAETYLTSVERCEHFERIAQEIEPSEPVSAQELAKTAVLGAAPAVEFRAISVRYRPRLPLVVRDLSLSIQPGERVGVIGRTGCGKSTLMLCLFRMLEVEATGQVLLHGVDIRKLRTTVLRRSIAAIPQVPLVYAGSLRENLDPLCELSDDALWAALQAVDLAAFAGQLAGGLDVTLAEGGSNLSAGQRQLLTIARAMLRPASLVVCDEATSSCDPRTDALVQKALRGHWGGDGLGGAAMLTVAHRLDTLATHDRVVLLTPPTSGGPTGVKEILNPRSEKMDLQQVQVRWPELEQCQAPTWTPVVPDHPGVPGGERGQCLPSAAMLWAKASCHGAK